MDQVEPEARRADAGLPLGRKLAACLTIYLASTAANIDASAATVLLPALSDAFSVAPSAAIGVISAYQFTLLIAALPLSSLGEKIGFRGIYAAGLGLMLAGAIPSAMAPSLTLLMAARMLSGLGAACTMSASAGILRGVFGYPNIGAGLSLIAIAAGIATALGPLATGALLSDFSWRVVFTLPASTALCALSLAWFTLPDQRGGARNFDWLSALVYIVTALTLLAAASLGFGQGQLIAAAALTLLGIAGGAWFTRRQLGAAHPIVPFDLFGLPAFAISLSTSFLAFAGLMIAFTTFPFHLSSALRLDPLNIGVAIAAWPVGAVLAAPLAGLAADRGHGAWIAPLALFCAAGGLLALRMTPADASVLNACWPIALSGFGFGAFQTANNRIVIRAAPAERIGAAGGSIVLARLLGQGAGAAGAALAFGVVKFEPTATLLAFAAAIMGCAAVLSIARLRGAQP